MGAYFDNAATTYPKPEVVYTFMDHFYRKHGGNAGRGQYKLAASASRIMNETRQFLKELLSCPNKDILFAPSDTIALNQIIQGSISDKVREVYISPFEHNAVTRVLHHFEVNGKIRIHVLPIKKDFTYNLENIQLAFNKTHPDMVIISHASNVCGLIAPVEEIFAAAKQYDAITIVDMAQTAGLIPLHVGSDNIDYAAFAGHKTLYGPFGIAGFAKKASLSPEPILFGGTGVDSANQDMPLALPSRYEIGSQNIQAIAGLHAALKWRIVLGNALPEQEGKNHRKLCAILRQYDNITIVGPNNRDDCIGVVSCVFDGYSSDNISDVLDRFEIAVRSGLDCAPIAHKHLGTFPAGTVRFSVGYFTSEQDFTTLRTALDYIEENS